MKNLLKILLLTIALVIASLLELLQKMVIWDSPLKENLTYGIRDYSSHVKYEYKLIYWPNVFLFTGFLFLLFSVTYYCTGNANKMIPTSILSLICMVTFIWLAQKPKWQVKGGNSSYGQYLLWFYIVAILIFLSSCSKGQCPTTNKSYFYKGVPKPKPLYKGYRSNKGYIVPSKYRKGVINYGKLK